MAVRKKTPRRTSATDAPEGSRILVLFEQIQEQNRATIEAVTSLEQRMDRRFDEESRKNDLRFSALEAAVRVNADLIRQNTEAIRQNSEDIRKNSEAIRQNSEDIRTLFGSVERLTSAVESLARRMDRVEEALGLKADAAVTADLEARLRRIEHHLGLSPA